MDKSTLISQFLTFDTSVNPNGRSISSDAIAEFIRRNTDASGHFRADSLSGELSHGDSESHWLPDRMAIAPRMTYSGISVDEDGNRHVENPQFLSFDIIKTH